MNIVFSFLFTRSTLSLPVWWWSFLQRFSLRDEVPKCKRDGWERNRPTEFFGFMLLRRTSFNMIEVCTILPEVGYRVKSRLKEGSRISPGRLCRCKNVNLGQMFWHCRDPDAPRLDHSCNGDVGTKILFIATVRPRDSSVKMKLPSSQLTHSSLLIEITTFVSRLS